MSRIAACRLRSNYALRLARSHGVGQIHDRAPRVATGCDGATRGCPNSMLFRPALRPRKTRAKGPPFSMCGVPAIAANPREGSRLLRFWAKVPNTSSEIGTTRLARPRVWNSAPGGLIPPCSRIQRRRARATSSRLRSAAMRLFFNRDVMAGEETGERATACRYAPLTQNPNHLIQSQIRLLRDQSEDSLRVLLQRRNAPSARHRLRSSCESAEAT